VSNVTFPSVRLLRLHECFLVLSLFIVNVCKMLYLNIFLIQLFPLSFISNNLYNLVESMPKKNEYICISLVVLISFRFHLLLLAHYAKLVDICFHSVLNTHPVAIKKSLNHVKS